MLVGLLSHLRGRAVQALVVCLALAALPLMATAAENPWEVPPEGACRTRPVLGAPRELDAVLGVPMPGETVTLETVGRLGGIVPEELWLHHDRFFFDGMNLEVGPCYRDYSPPAFFREATQKHAGQARLAPDGSLQNHRAGLPFPPHTIEPNDPRAGLKWAWNFVYRYRGAGSFGDFRISVVNDRGVAESWTGDSFLVGLTGRTDRPQDGYRYPVQTEASWAAGGTSRNLKTGTSCTFRQYASGGRKPDYFVASGDSRRIQRVAAPDSEGAFTACLADAAIGAGLFLHGGEPHLHEWEVVEVTDLLAPINTVRPTYPEDRDRGYGPWGISFADDRWELRRVLVLSGRLKEGQFEDGTTRFVWYLDLQTLSPLYYAGFRKKGDPSGVGYFVTRWSEDREDYPRWPDDETRPLRVLDEIGSAFVDWNDQHAVRTESGNSVAVPKSDKQLKRKISLSSVRVR